MRRLKYFKKTIYFLAIIILSVAINTNCAVMDAPGGGEKDNESPKTKKISPPDQSINFNEKHIKIKFDEYIKTANLFQQLIVSPPVNPNPQIYADGKTLHIILKSELKQNTTYTIQLGNSVQDINEGNEFKDLKYVFSTGNIIDSFTVSGFVNLAKDNSVEKDAVVMLYPDEIKDSVTKRKPWYVAKVNADGSFKISNISKGNYSIFGIVDKNQNYIYDQTTELIAFNDQQIKIDSIDSEKIILKLFQQFPQNLKIVDQEMKSNEHVEFVFSKPVKKIKIDRKDTSPRDIAWLNNEKDTITYWFSSDSIKSQTFYIALNDTLFDTLRIQPKTEGKKGISKAKFNTYSIDLQQNIDLLAPQKDTISTLLNAPQSLKIFFTVPTTEINKNKELHFIQNNGQKATLNFKIDSANFLSANSNFLIQTDGFLTIPDSTFFDFKNRANKKCVLQIKYQPKEYGNIFASLKIPDPTQAYIIQLLTAEKKVLREKFVFKKEQLKLDFKNLPEGNYFIRAIEDKNRDGKWTTGNLQQKIQPEKVIDFPKNLELKSGWDLETDVIFKDGIDIESSGKKPLLRK